MSSVAEKSQETPAKTLAEQRDQLRREHRRRQGTQARGATRPGTATPIDGTTKPKAMRPQAMARPRRMNNSGQRRVNGYRFDRVAAAESAELLIFGYIGDDYWGDGCSAKTFHNDLRALGNLAVLTLRINSGGGDVFDASSMFQDLMEMRAGGTIVKGVVQGVAASAATMLAMACSPGELKIASNAHWMIHAASGGMYGNARELEAYLTLLNNADEQLRKTYAARTGISMDELKDMLSFDNWMTAQKAFDLGFVDGIADASDEQADMEPESPDDRARAPVQITSERLAYASERVTRLAAMVGGDVVVSSSRVQAPAAADPPASNPSATEEHVSPILEGSKMPQWLIDLCIAAGMASGLDADAQKAWYAKNSALLLKLQTGPAQPVTGSQVSTATLVTGEPLRPAMDETAIATAVNAALDARERAASERLTAARNSFRENVDASLLIAFDEEAITEDLRQTCYNAFDPAAPNDMTRVRDAIKQARQAATAGSVATPGGRSGGNGPTITFAHHQDSEQAVNQLSTAFQMRVLNASGMAPEMIDRAMPNERRAANWQDLRRLSLVDLCAECLRADGMYIAGMSPMQVAQCAFGGFSLAGVRVHNNAGYGYHDTGSLSVITQDAINKSLNAGFAEAPVTWRGPFRQGTSASDFKLLHRIDLSNAPNLSPWPDGTVPSMAALNATEETYMVEAFAQEISFTWQMVVNNDLDSIGRTPFLMGNAAARTVNTLAWSQITANPTMSDGVALFSAASGNRKRSNLTTGAATPTVTSVGTMKNKMRQMRGVNTKEGEESQDVLNLAPTYIIAPTALETIVDQLVRSIADPASGGNSNVHNPTRTLTPVYEPLLDANSVTAWYLAVDPSKSGMDTVEVTFLEGQESPVTNVWTEQRTWARVFTIVQTFGTKVLNHRGLQKHNGT